MHIIRRLDPYSSSPSSGNAKNSVSKEKQTIPDRSFDNVRALKVATGRL